jgi:hypothetical protein
MKANCIISRRRAAVAVAAVLGMLAAVPAQALGGSGQIKHTNAPTPYKSETQTMSPTLAKAQAAAAQQTPAEFQVAVMAKSASHPAARRSVFVHR